MNNAILANLNTQSNITMSSREIADRQTCKAKIISSIWFFINNNDFIKPTLINNLNGNGIVLINKYFNMSAWSKGVFHD